MVQADSDIMLIDEVLAVGDAAFQQKCSDVFHEMRRDGKTVVLVTHNMGAVEEYCHRAMLLSDGDVAQIGDPGEVARGYLRLNFEQARKAEAVDGTAAAAADIRLLDVWLEDGDGRRIENVEEQASFRLQARLEANREVSEPLFGFIIANADGVHIHEFVSPLPHETGVPARLVPGQRIDLSVSVENRLAPGRYYVHHGVVRNRNRDDQALFAPNVLGFVVFGDQGATGIVSAEHEMRVELQGADAK
jgi:hypothetical protein